MPQPVPDLPAASPAKRRLPRLLAALAVAVLALGLGLPPLARHVIGPERLRAVAAKALTDALGRETVLSGDVSITLNPWLGLSMGPVAVADAPGFGQAPLFTANKVEMTIRMLPLLAKVVSPGSVRADGVTVHLARQADGRTNWDDLAAPKDAAAGSGWTVVPQPRAVRLENVSLRYDDAATGRSLSVTGARLRTGVGQPFDFAASFQAHGLVPDGSLECHLQGRASFDPGSGRLGLHATRVETGLVLNTPLVPGGAVPVRAVSRCVLDYDAGAAALTLSDIDARAAGLRLTGTAGVSDLPGAPRLAGRLELDAELDGGWRELLGLSRPGGSENLVAVPGPQAPSAEPTPAAPAGAALRAPLHNSLTAALVVAADDSGLHLTEFTARLPKGTVGGTARATLGYRPSLIGELTAEDVDFNALGLGGDGGWPVPGAWIFGCDMDLRAVLRRCTAGSLDIAEAGATLRAGPGLVRLAPASAVLAGGQVVNLDARLSPAGGPDGGPGCDIAAALEPAGLKTRFSGRLDATGAAGAWSLASPDAAATAKALGLGALPAGPVEAKGQLTLLAEPSGKWMLSNLDARAAGLAFRGQLGSSSGPADGLGFDLSVDHLDLDRAAALAAGGAPASQPQAGALPRAKGKLRLEQVSGRGLDLKNAVLDLTLGEKGLSAVLESAEAWGGKLSGSLERQATGRLGAALQLSGAEAGRLTAKTAMPLAGPVSAKITLDAAGGPKGRLGAVSGSIEAEAPQLALTKAGQRQPIATPKASLTFKGHEGADGFDGEAGLTLSAAGFDGGHGGPSLRDIRLALAGPVSLDRDGRPRETMQGKLEATAQARPAGGGSDTRLSLAGPVVVDASGGFTAGDLAVTLAGATATAKVWRKGGEAGPIQFSLDTGMFSPRQVFPTLGLALPAQAPPQLLAKASLAVAGAVEDKAVAIHKLAASLDDTRATGHGSFERFDPWRGKWELAVDRLDLDAYSPHKPAAGPPSLADRRKPLDLKPLREAALEAKLHFGWLKKGNVTFDAATASFNAKNGLFTFRQESPRFYGGRLFVEVRGDARDTALKTAIELKLEGIEIARFLHDWADGDTLASGACTFVVAARTSGASEGELRDNLAGTGNLQITRGEIKVRDPDKLVDGKPQEERLPFEVFSSSWNAKGGVAHSDDFRIESPRMLVAGRGECDLRHETINLTLMATLSGGSQVPATIIGPLDGPKVTIDRSRIIGDMVYRVLQGIVSIPGKAVTRILNLPGR
jgi:AsmA protein